MNEVEEEQARERKGKCYVLKNVSPKRPGAFLIQILLILYTSTFLLKIVHQYQNKI